MTDKDPFNPADWENAVELSLRHEPRSEAAQRLVDTLMAGLPFAAPKKLLKASTVARRRKALGAILADLLKLKAQGVIGSHPMARQNFSLKAHGFAFSIFKDVKNALVGAGLVDFKEGRSKLRTAKGFDGVSRPQAISGGWVARLQLTSEGVENIEAAGVTLDAWDAHWTRSAPLTAEARASLPMPALVGLRASNEWKGGTKERGVALPFSLDEPGVAEMIRDLEAHNGFMATLGVHGIDFLGLRRVFNEGEREDRRWRSGGRFYSINVAGIGTRFENMPANERTREIRIGGQPVAEVDMSASQLRLLYALQDTPMPHGLANAPYVLPGFSREPVKLVVAQALGKGKARSKFWGRDAVRAYAKRTGGRSLPDDFDFLAYQDATLAAHPILETLGQPGVFAALELQFVESEIVRLAMTDLRRQGIGSLPVHDSLIVPLDRTVEAERALQEAFRTQVDAVLGYSSLHRAKVDRKAA